MPKLIFLLLGFLFISKMNSQQLGIMSYNIKYANETDGENSWSNRKDFLGDQLKFYEPDVLGVQEALPVQIHYLDSVLTNYRFVGVGRDGGANGEYSAIFYKPAKLELLEADTFWLSRTPSKPSKSWDAAFKRICTYALFKEIETGRQFWVLNTHFDHQGKNARKQSARLIIEKIEDLNPGNLPLVFMGDLNLEPQSEPIQLLLKDLKDAKKNAEVVSFGSEATFNAYNFSEAPSRRIDYLMVNEKVKVLKFATFTDSKNQRYPSDHFPVYARVQLMN